MTNKKVSEKKGFTRVLVGSDSHCGAYSGLTPPEHWRKGSQFYEQQKRNWNFYSKVIKSLGHIDLYIFNGDAIDGKGKKSGGTDQFEMDMSKQVAIAEKCIRYANADSHRLIFGTDYHTRSSDGEDWEAELALRLQCGIRGHDSFAINGVAFDVKHKIGSGQLPHTRFTPLAKVKLWNDEWALEGGQKRANIIIRSHVHYFCGVEGVNWRGFITPALQGFGSKYGVRQCEGIVNFGLVWFDIYNDGSYVYDKAIDEYEVVEKNGSFDSRLKGL